MICDVKDYQIILSRDELKELKSHVRELEAERDRLIENISTLLAQRKEAQHKSIDAMMEVAELRARHAALVEAASDVDKQIDRRPDLKPHFSSLSEKLKAALAEVKEASAPPP